MKNLPLHDNTYATEKKTLSFPAATFPSLYFYLRLIATVTRSARLAQKGQYGEDEWGSSSLEVLEILERMGVDIRVSGMDHIRNTDHGPCVIIGNHMSFLETLLLPGLILPKSLTFVIKQSLLEYPVFKHVMRSSNPIAVSRVNPRQDLKTVLEEGVKRLEDGVSVVVFPQSTRSHNFEPAQMGSIGVKLAKRANVPVLPMALKTDALQNGRIIKDFGAINRDLPVRIAFAAPFAVTGKGNEEMDIVNEFIGKKLLEWGQEILVRQR
ncbi:lysophospholipid acyltransferase family protein [Desulfopila aestuarii]|uniref:1-acyl-sn-glycerol-3-phosphate acyltransferase n=1 Tax=Desulfopila aestuarii DSM 18488 TaxID=1121416 RepID=A0A1M7YH86_9BACT|nr:lysophospholipid acyltransferase family protein [Desulfopila aestuarii]SHO51949.1 1-acyl-sn-glycerol-3-phosphate acyltransferase [Desulfopila aestuarii DSM 18488]